MCRMIESINKITDVKDLSNAISAEVSKVIIGNDKLIIYSRKEICLQV